MPRWNRSGARCRPSSSTRRVADLRRARDRDRRLHRELLQPTRRHSSLDDLTPSEFEALPSSRDPARALISAPQWTRQRSGGSGQRDLEPPGRQPRARVKAQAPSSDRTAQFAGCRRLACLVRSVAHRKRTTAMREPTRPSHTQSSQQLQLERAFDRTTSGGDHGTEFRIDPPRPYFTAPSSRPATNQR